MLINIIKKEVKGYPCQVLPRFAASQYSRRGRCLSSRIQGGEGPLQKVTLPSLYNINYDQSYPILKSIIYYYFFSGVLSNIRTPVSTDRERKPSESVVRCSRGNECNKDFSREGKMKMQETVAAFFGNLCDPRSLPSCLNFNLSL